jgi:hypothetical protein
MAWKEMKSWGSVRRVEMESRISEWRLAQFMDLSMR